MVKSPKRDHFHSTNVAVIGRSRETLSILERLPGPLDRIIIIDVGCGEGYLLTKLPTGIGIDIRQPILKKATKLNREKKFICCSATNLPFKKNVADIVIIADTLEHIKESSICLEEINRVLKKGGYCVLTVPTDRLIYKILDPQRLYSYHRHYSKEEISALVKEKGFNIEEIYERGLILSSLFGIFFLIFYAMDRYLFKKQVSTVEVMRKIFAPIINCEFKLSIDLGYDIFLRMKKITHYCSN